MSLRRCKWTTTSDLDFIYAYRPIANESRRILFVLTLVAALGSLDVLIQVCRALCQYPFFFSILFISD